MKPDDLRDICLIGLSCHGQLLKFEDLDNLYLHETLTDNERNHAATISSLLRVLVAIRVCYGQISDETTSKSVDPEKSIIRYIQSAEWFCKILKKQIEQREKEAKQDNDDDDDDDDDESPKKKKKNKKIKTKKKKKQHSKKTSQKKIKQEQKSRATLKKLKQKTISLSTIIRGASNINIAASIVVPLLPRQINLYGSMLFHKSFYFIQKAFIVIMFCILVNSNRRSI